MQNEALKLQIDTVIIIVDIMIILLYKCMSIQYGYNAYSLYRAILPVAIHCI